MKTVRITEEAKAKLDWLSERTGVKKAFLVSQLINLEYKRLGAKK